MIEVPKQRLYTPQIHEENKQHYGKFINEMVNSHNHLVNVVNELQSALLLVAKKENNPQLFSEDHYLAELVHLIQATKLSNATKLTIISSIQAYAYMKNSKMSNADMTEKFSTFDSDAIKKYFKEIVPESNSIFELLEPTLKPTPSQGKLFVTPTK